MTKKYWLKIEKIENISYLVEEGYLGLAWKVIFKSDDEQNYSILNLKEEESMIIYVRELMKFYLGRIINVKIGNEEKEDNWVHFIHLEPVNNNGFYIGKIEDWSELKQQLSFVKKYPNIGAALNCSMRKIEEQDFMKIVDFFKR